MAVIVNQKNPEVLVNQSVVQTLHLKYIFLIKKQIHILCKCYFAQINPRGENEVEFP